MLLNKDTIFTSKPLPNSLGNSPVFSDVKPTYLSKSAIQLNDGAIKKKLSSSLFNNLHLGIKGYREELKYLADDRKYDTKLCHNKPAILQYSNGNKSTFVKFEGREKFERALIFAEKNKLSVDDIKYLANLVDVYKDVSRDESVFIDNNFNNYAIKNQYRLGCKLVSYKIEQDGSITENYKTSDQVH